jgi:hypothetical protein
LAKTAPGEAVPDARSPAGRDDPQIAIAPSDSPSAAGDSSKAHQEQHQRQSVHVSLACSAFKMNTDVEMFIDGMADLGPSREYNIDLAPRVSRGVKLKRLQIRSQLFAASL